MFDQDENLRDSIRKNRARIAEIQASLARPLTGINHRGPWRVSASSRLRTQEDLLHLERCVSELEVELLLSAHRKSTDADHRARIEKQPAERNIYLQKTKLESADIAKKTTPQSDTTPAESGIQAKEAGVALGGWAEERLGEARNFARLVRAGNPAASLRQRFPRLFGEVFDILQKPKRDRLFSEASRKQMTVSDLMVHIADVKGYSGATLEGFRKKYRSKTGTARPRRSKNTKRIGICT